MNEQDEIKFKAGFIAVVGKPNVGKSTLINALMGQKIAAVSPRPQTTRRQQLGILSSDTYQIIFMDTPGMHKARHKLGNYMNDEAQLALEDSDAVVWVVDASDMPEEEDLMIGKILAGVGGNTQILLGLNKTDLLNAGQLEKRRELYHGLVPRAKVMPISAVAGQGLDELMVEMVSALPEHLPFYDPEQITDLYEREIAADLIREAALNLLRDEVPHGVAVRMDEYTEREDKGAYIEATIFVERDSQKGIVVGKGGEMIKQLSMYAREEIEKMSGRKVYLRLRVKVRKNWRNDENQLRLFGFQKKGR